MSDHSYRNFSITTRVGKGNLHYYRISGNRLRVPIQGGMGESTEARAVDEAKEFIDEHLHAAPGQREVAAP